MPHERRGPIPQPARGVVTEPRCAAAETVVKSLSARGKAARRPGGHPPGGGVLEGALERCFGGHRLRDLDGALMACPPVPDIVIERIDHENGFEGIGKKKYRGSPSTLTFEGSREVANKYPWPQGTKLGLPCELGPYLADYPDCLAMSSASFHLVSSQRDPEPCSGRRRLGKLLVMLVWYATPTTSTRIRRAERARRLEEKTEGAPP